LQGLLAPIPFAGSVRLKCQQTLALAFLQVLVAAVDYQIGPRVSSGLDLQLHFFTSREAGACHFGRRDAAHSLVDGRSNHI